MEKREEKVIEAFGNHFSTLEDASSLKAQTVNDANLFSSICGNIINDLTALDISMKELRSNIFEGKDLYGKCVLAHKFTQDISKEIKNKQNKLENIVNELKGPRAKTIEIKQQIRKIYDELRTFELNRDRILKIFSLLREHLTLKIDIVQRQLDTCLEAK